MSYACYLIGCSRFHAGHNDHFQEKTRLPDSLDRHCHFDSGDHYLHLLCISEAKRFAKYPVNRITIRENKRRKFMNLKVKQDAKEKRS